MPGEHPDADAETPSITRLEGSRWRGGRLWSWNQDLRAWTGWDQEAGGARATTAPARRTARASFVPGAAGAIRRSRHTAPESWGATLPMTPAVTEPCPYEVSNLQVVVASWSADRIGPTIIAAPHRGQAHVARVGVSGAAGAGGSGAGDGAAGGVRRVRARATREVRHALARKPDCRMRTKPRGRMCWTKRRRNSMAVSVIVRRASP
jgi:hypothetical protein